MTGMVYVYIIEREPMCLSGMGIGHSLAEAFEKAVRDAKETLRRPEHSMFGTVKEGGERWFRGVNILDIKSQMIDKHYRYATWLPCFCM